MSPVESALLVLALWHALVMHEVAHAYMANLLGDPTAAQAGRLSWNPLRHMDPMGSLVVPVLMYALAGVPAGWLKSVPIDVMRLRHKGRDMFYVAGAGPAMSATLALFMYVAYVLTGFDILHAAAGMNAAIGLLNMVPTPPLDGGRMLVSRLPHWLGVRFERVAERWGLPLLACVLGFVMWSTK